MPHAMTPDFAYLPQDGEMAKLLCARDRSATLLGPTSTWPDSLHLQLNICFDSPFALALWWRL